MISDRVRQLIRSAVEQAPPLSEVVRAQVAMLLRPADPTSAPTPIPQRIAPAQQADAQRPAA